MKEKVTLGDVVCLLEVSGRRHLIDTKDPFDKYKGIGVFDPASLVGSSYGEEVTIGNKSYLVFSPSVMDKLFALKRNAQIILPRDISRIVLECSIEPGAQVLEAGIGSGSLTIGLASMVGENGKVISYELRDDFIDHARGNIRRAGILDRVEIHQKDVTKGIDHTNLDAIILDIPNPEEAIGHAWSALRPGGYLCVYTPLVSQMEAAVLEMRESPFVEIRSFENIQREMVVEEYGSRPSFSMLGHTAYLSFARKRKGKEE